MKKKIFLPIIIVLLAIVTSIINASSVSASIIDDDGYTWFSARELIPVFNKSLDLTREACDEYDYDCWAKMFQMQNGINEVSFADTLFYPDFAPITINPELGTMTVLFSDGGLWERGTPDLGHSHVEEVFLAWFEGSTSDTPLYDKFELLRKGNAIPGSHVVFSWHSYKGEFPYLEEVEIPLEDSLPVNDEIYYYIYSTSLNGSTTDIGIIDYRSCTSSGKYEPGMECRLFLPSNYGRVYIPYWSNDHSDITYDTIEKEEDAGIYEPTLHPGQFIDAPEEEPSNTPEQIIEDLALSVPTAPDTGALNITSTNKKSSDIVFPWWIALIIVINLNIYIWFFVPNNNKKGKNYLKKH